MKSIIIFFLIIFFEISIAAIYGENDDRQFVDDVFLSNLYSHGIYPAAMFDSQYDGETIGERWNLCQGAPFREMPGKAVCSGFLIAPDLLVTAGHCLGHDRIICGNLEGIGCAKKVCEKADWVFGYEVSSEKQKKYFKCKKVIEFRWGEMDDWAIIRLDRKASFFRKRPAFSSVSIGDSVAIAGHPLGLPLVFTGNAKITSVSKKNNFFVSDVDAFKANSGSVVVNDQFEIIGLLVAGDPDSSTDILPAILGRGDFQPVCRKTEWCVDCEGNEDIVPIENLKRHIR